MTQERKQELLAKAAKVLTRAEMENYRNFINNYELISKRNDERISRKYITQ